VAYGLHVRGQYESVDEGLVEAAAHFAEIRVDPSVGALEALDASAQAFVQLYDSSGTPIDRAASEPPLDARAVLEARQGAAYPAVVGWLPGGRDTHDEGSFATARDPTSGERLRLFAMPLGGPQPGAALTWTSLKSQDDSAAFLAKVMLGLVAGGVTTAGLGTFVVASNVLKPVTEMTRTARAIAASRGFSRRLEDPHRGDELGRLAGTFNEMLASLEEAYRSQQRFVADAAHELRAPLTTILGNVELLRKKPAMPEAERAEATRFVDGEAKRLARIVDELLTLARADAGQTLELRPVELDRVLLEAIAQIGPSTAGHEVELREVEPALVRGDPDRLKELILNLLDNCLKYTPAGSAIAVCLRADESESILTVEDAGPGIAEEDLPHVFERFYRADKARGRDPGGTGLGLAIANWIVAQHEGEIGIESAPGRGTKVTVTIPLIAGATEQ
jgi:signal transduction histidine kinase